MVAIDFTALNTREKVTYVFEYLTVILAGVGLIGNTLTFLIFYRKRFDKVSFVLFMKVKMLSDSFILLHSFRHFISYIYQVDVTNMSRFLCKIAEYSVYVASSVSYLMLTFIVGDRMISIKYPNRFDFLKKPLVQYLLIMIAFTYSALFYIMMPVYYDLGLVANETVCAIHSPQSTIVFIFYLVNQTFITLAINNTLTFITMASVFKSRNKLKQNRKSLADNRDIKFAVNSIALDLLCFVCKTPMVVANLLGVFLDWPSDLNKMVFTINVALYTVENASSFVISYLVNSLFRNELHSILSFQITQLRVLGVRVGIKSK